MSPTEAPSRRTRNRDALVQAAEALFRAHGFEATTIDQIAAAARVSRRTFFRYFPTKDAVVFPHAEARLELFRGQLEAQAGETPLETVRRACRVVAQELIANREELSFQQALIDSSPILQARERNLDRAWEDVLAEALLRDRRRTAAARRRAALVAGAVMGTLRAAVRVWHAGAGALDIEELGEEAFALVASALEEVAQ